MSGINKKIVFLLYDLDTMAGTDNYGRLKFDYHLEDIDTVDGEKVYAGQDSVLWKNVRAAFNDELTAMYRNLRSGDNPALSYTRTESMYEEHQNKWPEALVNEDEWYKYILPLIQDNENRLEMCLGLKAEQRKWWLYNRFKYIDSKYNAGDASADSVSMRTYYEPVGSETYGITVTPYADIYATVMYGVAKSSVRAARNVGILVPCTLSHLEFTDTYIYSASQIKSFGDLSIFRPDAVEFSRATHIQELKLGDSSNSYTNPNLKALNLGNNVLLKKIDCRNCVNMGTGSQKTVDLSGCSNIEEVYFDGTAIQGMSLPNGGFLKKLHLPSTITNLTVLNQKNVTEFVCPGFTNVTTLRVENCSSAINTKSIVQAIPAATRLRLVGFYWECTDADEIEDLLDIFDSMRGLDEQGNTINIADGGCRTSVSGTIHTDSLTGSQIAAYRARYPYLNVTADHTSAQLRFYNGNTLLTTVTVLDGGNGSYSGNTPTKTADAQYTYSFAGWSKDADDNTVDANALTAVTGDRNVYACYTGTLRKYSVYFVRASADGGGTLQTVANVNYGTTVTAASAYTGATPTTTQGSATDYPFEGWEPASAMVTGNITFTAKFGSPIDVSEITDSWDTIIQHIDAGDYATRYKIGQYKPLDLGTEGIINMQIVAMDADELASGGYAPLTFIGMEALATQKKFYNRYSKDVVWSGSDIRAYLANATFIPSNIKLRLQNVKKYTITRANNINSEEISIDRVWAPSARELNPSYETWETAGVIYNKIFASDNDRIISNTTYWTRSGGSLRLGSNGKPTVVNSSGVLNDNQNYTDSECSIRLGFCLGGETETIADDWATILSNPNYATDYSIGDTKSITINGEQHLMQIVAFDADDKAGGGKAKISWLMKDLMNDDRAIDSRSGATRKWETTEMRSWLRETILPTIDTTIRNHIVDVDKTSYYTTNLPLVITSDKLWLASRRELFGNGETSGATYTQFFAFDKDRIKKKHGTIWPWWTRSGYSSGDVSTGYVNAIGNISSSGLSMLRGVCIGFCTD